MRTMNQNNRRKLVVSVWVTLDGIFDADTMEQWFMPYDSKDRQEYIRETIESSDALLLGGVTYEMLWPYWSTQTNDNNGPARKLNRMKKHVVSSTLEKAEWNNTQKIIRKDVTEEIRKLKREPGGDMLIPGSATLVQSLMQTDLIDEYQFLVHPVIMGSGKRFFKDGMPATKLELVNTKTFPLGVMLLCYQPAKI